MGLRHSLGGHSQRGSSHVWSPSSLEPGTFHGDDLAGATLMVVGQRHLDGAAGLWVLRSNLLYTSEMGS